MAEGGDENEDNPFSFKKFEVPKESERKSKGQEDKSVANGQILDILPDIGDSFLKNRRKDRTALVISPDEPLPKRDTSKPKKKKDGEDNPFSFKRFLSGSVAGSKARPKTFNTQIVGNTSGTHVTPSDLPDFVQDHFSEPPHDLSHPDFTVSSQLSETNVILHELSNERDNPTLLVSKSEPVVKVTGGNSTLPDFLSDGILKNDCEHSENRVSTLEDDGDYELELCLLREENSMLRTQLDEARREAVTESQRCHKMKKNMEDLQKKEAEENAALENMVQQIEANLSVTTKRALQAETLVSKLQTEVKSLQKQLTALINENELLRSGDQGLAEITERTKYSSEQLTSAANTAEQSLKQLLQGVDQMRLLAQVLSSIDKISEELHDEHSLDGQSRKTKQSKKMDKDKT